MIGHVAQDAKLERIIRRILQIGVTTSSVFLAIGLMILMATPVTRVAASVVEYAVERDWLFVALTSLVLLEIIGGVIAALVFHRRL